jgi:hypothetical protein
MRPLAQLRKHPAYVDLKLSVSAAQLAEIQRLGDLPFKDPILITAEGMLAEPTALFYTDPLKCLPNLHSCA